MLTAADVATFHRDGFLIMPGLIHGRELELLRQASATVIDQGVAQDGAHHLYHHLEDDRQIYWRSEDMWLRQAIFRAVTLNPVLLENIGQCIGDAFLPWNDSLVVKMPGGGPVLWHQDPPYGDPARTSTTAMPNFTTDIYLDDSDPDNGCVYAIPGHHLVGHVDLSDKSQEDLFTRCGAVPVRMRPGDVLFHALSTPHGSRANPSSRMRRTFYIHYLSMAAYQASGYEPWGKPAWGPSKRAQLHGMADDRRLLGLEPAYGRHVAHHAHGLVVSDPAGMPLTPPLHWATCARALSEPERQRRARLPLLDAAASPLQASRAGSP